METVRQFLQRLKFVRGRDLVAIFPMLIGFTYSLFLRWYRPHIWLVCERKSEARDNGYWFFKYLREYQPHIDAVYAIDKQAPDFAKVNVLGPVIAFGGITHWAYYFAAKRNVSSQKEGKPNAALCFILEVYLHVRQNRAYIRHGVAKDKQRWVYYDVTKMNLFICSAQREYDYVNAHFGYPPQNVKLVGLCRFDNLYSPPIPKRQILIMPTMREWLRVISSDTTKYESSNLFTDSSFYNTWNNLLQNKQLHCLLERYNFQLVFYLHSGLQSYSSDFKSTHDKVIIAHAKDYDVQQLLLESAVLITDYSSVFFDFAYLQRPLLYYQFDYNTYRQGQYQEGYFSYEADGFGPVCTQQNQLLACLSSILAKNCVQTEPYATRAQQFFAFHDNKNCERTFHAIEEMHTTI